MRLLLFRFAVWLGGEGLVLAAFLFGLAIVAAPVWRQFLPATPAGIP